MPILVLLDLSNLDLGPMICLTFVDASVANLNDDSTAVAASNIVWVRS